MAHVKAIGQGDNDFANYNTRGVICNLRNNICDEEDINGDQQSFIPGLVKRKKALETKLYEQESVTCLLFGIPE